MALIAQRVRGFHDRLPEDAAKDQAIEAAAREVFARYGFAEVRLPAVERTELFVRSIGEETDIVGKEMYRFVDKGGDDLCLRPEGTAGAMRAYLQATGGKGGETRWFYVADMFRRERPQKGRLRQFRQVGCELFGEASPSADVEVLAAAFRILEALPLQGAIRLELNSLGCPACRPRYREALQAFLSGIKDRLCADCQKRSVHNPLRVLDCKNEACQAALGPAPEILAYLCEDCAAHFAAVRAGLDALGIGYRVNPRIVRGLDYYVRTAFEFVSDALGAQATVLAGGRYDGLARALGGPDVPAVGFAAGVERLALLMPDEPPPRPDVAIVAVGEKALAASYALAEEVRRRGKACVHCHGGS
ncbi:MAG: histidine--tRNA ligase, partial [Zetaproteobacteria bacterium]